MRTDSAKKTRTLAVTAMLAAIAEVLMILEFPVPLMPSFVKFDFSEIPALIASFSMGPISGVIVCLIKNLIHFPLTQTGGVGELCNFLLGVCFVLPAGWIYKLRHNRRAALISSLAGALFMAGMSVPINYFIAYPAYAKVFPLEQIIAAYQAILPSVDGLISCLLIFNFPFTFFKGLTDTLVTFLVYKHVSPLIKGIPKQKP